MQEIVHEIKSWIYEASERIRDTRLFVDQNQKF